MVQVSVEVQTDSSIFDSNVIHSRMVTVSVLENKLRNLQEKILSNKLSYYLVLKKLNKIFEDLKSDNLEGAQEAFVLCAEIAWLCVDAVPNVFEAQLYWFFEQALKIQDYCMIYQREDDTASRLILKRSLLTYDKYRKLIMNNPSQDLHKVLIEVPSEASNNLVMSEMNCGNIRHQATQVNFQEYVYLNDFVANESIVGFNSYVW